MAGTKKEDEAKANQDNKNIKKAAAIYSKDRARREDDKSGRLAKPTRDEDGNLDDKSYANEIRSIDATMRHIRRHPKQYKEAVELAESLLESYQSDCIYC